MATYFLIDSNNQIVNVISLDDPSNYSLKEGWSIKEKTDDRGWIGWQIVNDMAVQAQPYPSWTLDANGDWQPPTPYPNNPNKEYEWNESQLQWVEILNNPDNFEII